MCNTFSPNFTISWAVLGGGVNPRTPPRIRLCIDGSTFKQIYGCCSSTKVPFFRQSAAPCQLLVQQVNFNHRYIYFTSNSNSFTCHCDSTNKCSQRRLRVLFFLLFFFFSHFFLLLLETAGHTALVSWGRGGGVTS